MDDFVKVALDAHGGDNAPKEVVSAKSTMFVLFTF